MQYTEKNIKILKGLEAVRKRPGMYIGAVNNQGLHHLIWEILDNSIDEVLAGYCNKIVLTMHKDNSISIEDNGRGIPIGIHPVSKISTLDTIFTTLHAGGKFDDKVYQVSGGLHGVGSSVVNALSSFVEVTVKRDKNTYQSQYHNGGQIKTPNHLIAQNTKGSGTCVRFLPDFSIFKNCEFDPSLIKQKLKDLSFLFKGLSLTYKNEKTNESINYLSEKGISAFLEEYVDQQKAISEIIVFEGEENQIQVEIAFQYEDSFNENFYSFANCVKTVEGGSHETGFKIGLTETLNEYCRKWKILKDKDKNFEGSDFREGLSCVIACKIPESLISFEGQTKNKLFTQEASGAVRNILKNQLTFWLEKNKKEAKKIIDKAFATRDARLAAKLAKEDIKKLKKNKNERTLVGKLTPCQSKDKTQTELFLVEGDSAGGSAKLGRDKKYQAILPLKGKVINVEKAQLKDLLKNEEILNIIGAINGGIGENFNVSSVAYNKIIIMTDADVDGSHIRILLLTFFFKYMQPLFAAKKIYVALPPLYKFTNMRSKKFVYVWDEEELEKLKKQTNSYEIQRYKGLGEMNAEQLWETTMDPNNRKLVAVSFDDMAKTKSHIQTLMGEDTEVRKQWINQNINFDFEF